MIEKTRTITRIQNPAVFALDVVEKLFEKAFKKGEPAPAINVIAEMRRICPLPNVGVFVGWEDMEPCALGIVVEPVTKLFTAPHVYHFYNGGSTMLRNDLTDAIVDWTLEKGYTTMLGSNWTGRSDRTFERTFRRAGPVERIGTAYRIQVSKHE